MQTDGRGNATTNAYDSLGRLASVTDPLGATTHYTYDAAGNLASATNALGVATVYEYDIRGNKIYEGGGTYPVSYAYDAYSAITNMTTYREGGPGFVPAAGDTTTWIYDEATGLLTSKLYPDGNGPAYTYTIDGKPASRTWARGVVTEYTYDAWGNVRRVDYSDTTPSIVIDYDSMGRETNITDAAGTTAVLYDPCGAVANETVTGALGTKSISRFYDTFGRKTVYSSGALSLANPYRFSSEYADDTLGFVYYNYRHYNPLDGRWTSRDQIEDLANCYEIVVNNPVNELDILGRMNHKQREAWRRKRSFIRSQPGGFRGANPGDALSLAFDVIAYFRDKESAIRAGIENCDRIAPMLSITEPYDKGPVIRAAPCRCCVIWMLFVEMGPDQYYYKFISSEVHDRPCDKVNFIMRPNPSKIYEMVPWR